MALTGLGIWEFDQPADYRALANAGVRWVAVPATNNAGSGLARAYESAFPAKLAAAASVQVDVLAVTTWQGPPEGTEIDPTAYLAMCATYCAGLGFDPAGWVVTISDSQAPGLSDALRSLRSQTGKPVYVSFPGNPQTYGLQWNWAGITQATDGLMPQFFTSPANWNGSPDPHGSTDAGQGVRDAIAELARSGIGAGVMVALSDETDPSRVGAWIDAIRPWNPAAVGYWRWRPGDQNVVDTYIRALTQVGPSRQPMANAGPSTGAMEVKPMGDGKGGMAPGALAIAAPQPVKGWRQLVTPGPDGVEPGVFTSEFLATEVTALATALFALLAAFGVLGLSADQKKAVIDLAVAVIGALQIGYTASRSIRKGLASPSRQLSPGAAQQ